MKGRPGFEHDSELVRLKPVVGGTRENGKKQMAQQVKSYFLVSLIHIHMLARIKCHFFLWSWFSPTITWALVIELGSPGLHSKCLYPKPFLFELPKPQSSHRALVMFWLVSWHHFCSSSHILILNCSDGQVSEIVVSFVLLVKITGWKLHFPNVCFYI